MLAMAGQDIDQFMREMEVVHKKRETERAQDLNVRLSLLKDGDSEKTGKNSGSADNDHESSGKSTDHSSVLNHPAMSHPAMPLMGLPPPPPLLFRPPPPPIHLRMPPPPPPRHGLRLPPGIFNLFITSKLFFLIVKLMIPNFIEVSNISNYMQTF